jgi:succinate dehydrogenase / fumarate reductase iron-sulfur subunit
MAKVTFRIWRGDKLHGDFKDYVTEASEGMVVLDVVHRIQAEQAPDLAVRWNCKAGKCGSCSAEINGKPRLMCMTRMDEIPIDRPVTLQPMHAFPMIKDLVTDVSWNFEVKKRIKRFKPRPPDAPDGTWRMSQTDVCASTTNTMNSSDRATSCTAPRSRCIRSTRRTGSRT